MSVLHAWKCMMQSVFCPHIPKWHRQHGIDTFFIRSDSLKPCGTKVTVDTLVSQLSQKYQFYVLLDQGALPQVTNLSNVLAVFMGDEVDSKVWQLEAPCSFPTTVSTTVKHHIYRTICFCHIFHMFLWNMNVHAYGWWHCGTLFGMYALLPVVDWQ